MSLKREEISMISAGTLGIIIPFLGTMIGASFVFFLKEQIKPKVNTVLAGFASGVMMAAAVWSLLIPAIEMAEPGMGKLSFVPAAVGFGLGILFLLCMDKVIPHIHIESGKQEGMKAKLKKTTMLVFAVTLHNIPEGMAVGIVFAGLGTDMSGITLAGAMALAFGIALQNIPEGAIVSLPLKGDGTSKLKAFSYGMLSGIVEPIGAFITILLTAYITPILPYTLAFAAGAMVYVIIEELVPESATSGHSDIGTIGFMTGFIIMMILDVALG